MPMDQFVTTYRKEYLWPYVKTLGVRPAPETFYSPNLRGEEQLQCQCHRLEKPTKDSQQRDLMGPLHSHDESWSRLGPMGPLLDPKIYPAKVSAVPESQVARYNQPNVFLKKLQEKYPFIYECLRTAPPDDLLSRICRDRLRTTYQVDFCDMNEYPSAPYDELLRAAGVDGNKVPCETGQHLPGDPYRPRQKTGMMFKMKEKPCSTGGGSFGKTEEAKQCIGTCRGPLSTITAGATEYQDAISRLGMIILREKLHHSVQKNTDYFA